jgi:hypothetical protein
MDTAEKARILREVCSNDDLKIMQAQAEKNKDTALYEAISEALKLVPVSQQSH